jgi:hypothetical protein
MKNGDRFTCEIKRLDAGVLSVSLDYVDGTVSIQWTEVARLESGQLFTVQTQDGSIYTGKLFTAPPAAGGSLTLRVVSGVEGDQLISAVDIVDVTQSEKLFLQQLSGSLSAGATYAKGNDATQYNFATDLAYIRPRWSLEASYQSVLSATRGAETTTRNQFDFVGNRMLPQRRNTFFFGQLNLLQSSVQGIARQTSVGGGIGYYLKNSNQLTFSISGGLVGQNTRYEESLVAYADQKVAAGLIAVDVRAFKFKRSNLVISAAAVPAINQDRSFYRAIATYYLLIFSYLTWYLSFFGSWDTSPPAHLSGSDFG